MKKLNFIRNVNASDVKIKYSRRTNQELWDVMISSRTGDNLGAHKCVLSARSEYFNCMFGANWIEVSEQPNSVHYKHTFKAYFPTFCSE